MIGCIQYTDVLPAKTDSMQLLLWIWSLDHARAKHPVSMIVEAIDREINPRYRSPWKA